MSETKLLPCPNPWCASHFAYVKGLNPVHFVAQCRACGLECGIIGDSKENAIAAWNARPAPALTPKQEAAEEMFEALNAFMNLPHLNDDVCVDARPECKVCAAINIGRSALAKAGRAVPKQLTADEVFGGLGKAGRA